MDALKRIAASMARPAYEELKQSLERGRLPEGRPLRGAEAEDALRLLLAWEALHLPAEQRSGFMPDRCRAAETAPASAPQPAEGEALIARETGQVRR